MMSFLVLRLLVPHQGSALDLLGGLQRSADPLLISSCFWREKTHFANSIWNTKTMVWQSAWKNPWMKNLIFRFYLLISDFLVEQKQKLAEKDHSFYNKVSLKKSHSFYTNLNLLNILKNILQQHSQKHVFSLCQKKHLHCTISRRSRTAFSKHLESKYLYIPVNLR